MVAHILALVSSDARRRGATLHMLVPFCVDVQQHSNSTHQPQPSIDYSVQCGAQAHIACSMYINSSCTPCQLPPPCYIFIMGKTRLLVMLGAGQDKQRGRLATQFFSFFRLTVRKQHFRDKRFHILAFRDKTASIFSCP